MRYSASIVLFTALILPLPCNAINRDTGGGRQAVTFAHTPIYSTPARVPITILAQFDAPMDLQEMRVYFKTMQSNSYAYVVFEKSGKGAYTATLPAVKNGSGGIDYILLYKTPSGSPIRSKEFRILVVDNYDPPPADNAPQRIFTEESARGFDTSRFLAAPDLEVSGMPLLAQAILQVAPITVPGPGRPGSGSLLLPPGGVSVQIHVGGIGISYRSSN